MEDRPFRLPFRENTCGLIPGGRHEGRFLQPFSFAVGDEETAK